MPTVTLSSKIYCDDQLKHVEEHLKSSLKGLKVKIEGVQAAPRGWIQVTFSGEDEKAALSYLENTIGLCPTHATSLKKFSLIKGYITSLGKLEDRLQLDIGPNIEYVIIPLWRLQAQLTDGRKMALKKIVELYGLCENTPLITKIIRVDGNYLDATIAENQLKHYKGWIKSLLDRLIVLGVSRREFRTALTYARCYNDVVGFEQFGHFEHAAVCKLGTDAVGLVPKVGKKVPSATLTVFSPKKILKLIPEII